MTEAGSGARISRWRALVRLLRVLVHLIHGLLVVLLRFPALTQPQRADRVTLWARDLLRHMGIRLEVSGDANLSGPLLIVANHISWLDIVSLHAVRFCRFVSKADVRHWPVIGRLAEAAGTLFIERESRRDALRVVHHMAESLRACDVLAVFPEGTTSEGSALLPFHGNLLQAAIAVDAPVQAAAIQFFDDVTGEASQLPCYVGDDTLAASVWRTLQAQGLSVRVTLGSPCRAEGRDRRAWAHALRDEITGMRR